jgi:SAM-dependent MidA family methyltransferase
MIDDTPDVSSQDQVAAEHSRRLEELIRREAESWGGALPFDRFMELALYAPGLGYYAAGAAKLGPGGDFVTAPEISPLFGRCLGRQCTEVLDALGGGDVLELGAGSGKLALDLLEGLEEEGSLPRRYLILEPSADLRERQGDLLGSRRPDLAKRVDWLDRLPGGFRGVVIANEVLDAMPVHRFLIGDDGRALELFVRWTGGRWREEVAEPASPGLAEAVNLLQAGGFARDPGFASEANLRLAPWIEAVGEAVEQGLILLIDYGYPRAEYYHPDRGAGTLMCHYRHQAHGDPYVHVGLQDITAHVDFSAAANAGTKADMELAGFTTQAYFLIGCGLDELLGQIAGQESGLDLLLGAKQLVMPTGMGERFRVLGFGKGVSRPWRGFSFRDLRGRL